MKIGPITKKLTGPNANSIKPYLNEIRKTSLLNPEEIACLAKKVRENNDTKARNKNYTKSRNEIVQANLRFVVKVAAKYQDLGLSIADLIQAGNIGLIEAANRFDERLKTPFTSFAIWHIQSEILEALSQTPTIKIPSKNFFDLNKISQAIKSILDENETPSARAIAEHINATRGAAKEAITPEEVEKTLKATPTARSLDAPLHGKTPTTLLDILPGEDLAKIEEAHNKAWLEDTTRDLLNEFSKIKKLPNKRKQALFMFLGIGRSAMTVEEIAKALNLSKTLVYNTKNNAIHYIRIQLKNMNEI